MLLVLCMMAGVLMTGCGADNAEKKSNDTKVYSNNVAKYWYDNFLELDQRVSDEVNTDKAFRAIDSALNRNIKNVAPRDHTLLRNAVIAYFKSNDCLSYKHHHSHDPLQLR